MALIRTMRSLLRPGIATRLVLGVNALVLLVVLVFVMTIGSLMRDRLYRTVDFDLTHHIRTFNALIQQDQDFLAEEAMVIRSSDALDPALATRDARALRRLLRPFVHSHEFDVAYVLDGDGTILAQTDTTMADPERVAALSIVERARLDDPGVGVYALDGTIWIGAAIGHHPRAESRIDAVILLGQRIDAAYLKSIRNTMGPEVALTMQDHAVHSFDALPSGMPVPHLPTNPMTGAEYVDGGLAYRSIVVDRREYRAAGYLATVPDNVRLSLFVFEDTEQVNDLLRLALSQVAAIGLVIMLLSSAASFIYARRVVKPLEHLASSAQAIARGQFDQPVDTRATDEVGRLAVAFEQMRTRIQQMMAAQQAWAAELEGRVRAKTAELQALGELRDELLHRVIAVREEENRRVARDLHDETSQNLAAMIAITGAARQLPPEQAQVRTAELRPLLADTLNGIKRIMLDLRPALLDDQGLVPALRWYAHERLNPSGIVVHVRVDGPEQRLPPQVETCLFRVGQEAINNIVGHARAQQVELVFDFAGDEAHPAVTMRISDDGCGFDAAQAARHTPGAQRHLGLLGMRERVDLMGGSMDIQSAPGAGTQLCVHVAAPPNATEPERKP